MPICPIDAASTKMIPLSFEGQLGLDEISLKGAPSSVQIFFANFPMCRPQAISSGRVEASAIADPIVSMSPFLPVITATAPFAAISSIQV